MNSSNDPLYKLFGNRSRIQILGYLFNPTTNSQNTPKPHSHRITDIVSHTGVNQRLVSNEIVNLCSINLVCRNANNSNYYEMNTSHPYYPALKQLFTQDPWTPWERPARIHHLLLTLQAGLKPMHQYYGICLPTSHLLFQYDNVRWYYKLKEFCQKGEKLIPIYENNKSQIWRDFQGYSEILWLQNKYEDFRRHYTSFWKVAYVTELISFYIDSLLKPNEFITMKKPSFTDEYEDLLSKLAHKALVVGIENINTNKIIENYYWINNNYHTVRRLNRNEVLAEIEKRMKKPTARTKRAATNVQSIPKSLQRIGEDMVYMQDLRKKIMMKAADKLHGILKDIGSDYGITPTEMTYVLPEEIANIRTIKNIKDLIQIRQRACTITGSLEHGIEVFDGQLIPPDGSQNTSILELRGRVACGGRAVGRAVIIDQIEDLYKVNHGDVLVCSMTTPDMIPAIRRCVGIITNEGGITCHAAIIAREFNIPCIIATHNATNILRNRELVEVDADKGLITVLGF